MERQLEKLNAPRGARMTERSSGQSGVCVRKERSARKRWMDGCKDGGMEGWIEGRIDGRQREEPKPRKAQDA